ncbi:twin-arginine translocase subunit TatC [Pseudodesulfovibrio tunisiensis]|uniref:twin-arginine translocase subunit TatC n=1 Tax=Pseudodesulfovibrio tunisiensis TaxID=463192 RepID=UPI001FB54E6A|nr:twin-arginine translocase subunit TatC [Pseudodesulfovibrio tunisiensis]
MTLDKDGIKAEDTPENETGAELSADDPSLDDNEDGDSANRGLTLSPAKSADSSSEDDENPAGHGDSAAGGDSPVSDSDDSGEEDDLEDEDQEDEEEESGQMSLLAHLSELRTRLVRCVIAVGLGMLACYPLAERMFDLLMEPMKVVLRKVAESHTVFPADFFIELRRSLGMVLQGTDFKYPDKLDLFVQALQDSMSTIMVGGHFQYTYPAEAFFSHIKVAVVAGLFLVSPYLFAQIWGFIAPGLYDHERKWVVPMAMVSALFFTAGALFGYFIVFPFGFDFFASFATTEIAFTPKLNEYLSFCLKLLFAFGVVFELPLFIFFLARLGIVSSKGLRKKRKYAILVSFIVSAILTPPDPFTQTLMAGPLIILYELGVWVAYFFGKKEDRKLKKKIKEEPEQESESDEDSGEAETSESR